MNDHSISQAQSNRRKFGAAKLVFWGAALLAGLGFAAPGARAQSADLPRAAVVELLATQYAEIQSAIGLTTGGGLVEVFTAKDGSTWTLVLTRPDGTSQVIAAGGIWIRR